MILEVRDGLIYQNVDEQMILFDYLNNNYNLFITENIGYPKIFNKINIDLDVQKYCTRNGIADIICIDKKLTNTNFEKLFTNEYGLTK